MRDNSQKFIDVVGGLVSELELLSLNPVMVGGMALVLMGSTRVTQDFDFVVSQPGERIADIFTIFYKKGFQLVSKIHKSGEVIGTIDNKKVAEIRYKLDQPSNIQFINPESGLRVDLLFDFPLKATELKKLSIRKKIKSQTLSVASKQDLLRLKKIAQSNRSKAGDGDDIKFLKSKKDK